MTEEQKEDIKLLKELIADTSIPNDDREIYQEALNQILAQTKSDMPKEAKEKMPKKEKATPKTKPSKKPKAKKTTPLPSDVDAMKKAIKERTGKTEAECEDIIAQYRKLRAKAKVNNAKRTEKLKSNDDLITGTNVITPVAQIEKDAEIVKAKIEKQVEQIENKAEREVVKKDKTKDEVKVEVEQKVVKQLAKLSDDMVSSATTFVKNIQTELKKVDKTEAKNFLLGLRNEIDALLSKFGDGGSTIETYNITENESASSVNPSLFARGGGVDDGDFAKGGIIKINDNITIKDNKVMVNGTNGFINSGTINEWFEDTKKEVKSILNDKDENGEILYKRIAESDNFIYYTLDFEDFNNAKYKISDVLDYYAVHKASGRGGDWEIWNGLSFMPLQDEFKYGKLNYQHPSLNRLMQQDSYYKSRKKFATGGDIENERAYKRGGGVGNPSKKQMLDYLNMYFDNYSELRTIAIEEDNILTRRMLNSLDNEELQMAYDDAKYEMKAETQFARGGGVDRFEVGETENDYVVNVGNIGNIRCDSLLEARMMYNEYVEQSKSGMGRAGNEYVGLYKNGEPILEYFGTLDNDNEYKRGGGVRTGSDGREYPFGSAWALEHNKHNKKENYEIPKSSRKS